MIADRGTNVVFVADTLEPRFPEVFRGLREILADYGVPFGVIPGTRDIWCRDYMPVQVSGDRFVQFRYAPDYLTGRYRHLRKDGEIGPTLPWVKNCVRSEIVLDGGNVVKWTDKVILTEKIFEENPEWGHRRLLAELERLLEVERIILIPPEPGDITGHADGMVRFLDEKTVLLNDYRDVDQDLRRRLLRRLRENAMNAVEVPYRPRGGSFQGIPSAVGSYVNYLEVGPLLVLPAFGLLEDQNLRNTLGMLLPAKAPHALPCRQLAKQGGVLNCVCYTVYSPSGLIGF